MFWRQSVIDYSYRDSRQDLVAEIKELMFSLEILHACHQSLASLDAHGIIAAGTETTHITVSLYAHHAALGRRHGRRVDAHYQKQHEKNQFTFEFFAR